MNSPDNVPLDSSLNMIILTCLLTTLFLLFRTFLLYLVSIPLSLSLSFSLFLSLSLSFSLFLSLPLSLSLSFSLSRAKPPLGRIFNLLNVWPITAEEEVLK